MFEWVKNLFRRKPKMENSGVIKNEVQTILRDYLLSPKYKDMIKGIEYYIGAQDILKRQRVIMGADGKLVSVGNLINNKMIDNQYAKMVNQKTNYLLSKPISLNSENKDYADLLNGIFDKKFHKSLKQLGKDCYNTGVGWLYVYYDEIGNFKVKRMDPLEIIPVWKDKDHEGLEYVIRTYQIRYFDKGQYKTKDKVEVYTINGIEYYESNGSSLSQCLETVSYMSVKDDSGKEQGYNWKRIPFIPFRADETELSLLLRVKSLQDGINTILSDFQNNMEEDYRNSIFVLKGYDGTDLKEFRQNLIAYGAIKIDGEGHGGVDTITVDVNSSNYEAILKTLKKALIENARGFDSKSDMLGSNPNQMNIQSMYSDIDLDANEMETEFQSSFEQLLWFINQYFVHTGKGDFSNEKVDIIFNRDILINESIVIEDISKSVGILSEETLISQHPYVSDVEMEIKRKKEETTETVYPEFPKSGDIDGKEKE